MREETAEELAMVVSPHPQHRPTPVSPCQIPSIEVLSPWKTSGTWNGEMGGLNVWSPSVDHGDQTPLLNISTPSSDAGKKIQMSEISHTAVTCQQKF